MSDEMENKMEETEQPPVKKKGSGYVFYIVIAVVLILFLGFRMWWVHNFGVVQVDGQSMMRTLEHGDELIMRFVKDGKGLKRGDVIVVKVRDYNVTDGNGNEIDFLIKRLIAVEGDKVRCTNGRLEICYQGESEYVLLNEPYAYYDGNMELYDFSEYVVEEGEIFFLGDNRLNSCDSRYQEWGGSHLDDLYKATDVYGVVPTWAIEHKEMLEKIFIR